jgi:hypothetical protein
MSRYGYSSQPPQGGAGVPAPPQRPNPSPATRTIGPVQQVTVLPLQSVTANILPNADAALNIGAAGSRFLQIHCRELHVDGAKVVGARKTGWTAATGSATRTTFATGTVTLPQLAERVKALIDDLHAGAGGHGLIGT